MTTSASAFVDTLPRHQEQELFLVADDTAAVAAHSRILAA